MPSPSLYLEASLARWSSCGSLARRDLELALEDLQVKLDTFKGLREVIRRHRHEDLGQLAAARQEARSRWEERLTRLEEWTASAEVLGQSSRRQCAWRDSALWFDRAQTISRRYGAMLEKKAVRLEKDLAALGERIQQWSDRLFLKQKELKEFAAREAFKGTEIFVSSARKRPYLDFVYAEREEEARLARQLKGARGSANHALARLARFETRAAQNADTSPAYFEIRKNQLLDGWRPVQRRFAKIREAALNQALAFEEGRPRLRGIYETIQRMRVIQETPPRRRPLLDRLFNLEPE